jgi:hypothetical protein
MSGSQITTTRLRKGVDVDLKQMAVTLANQAESAKAAFFKLKDIEKQLARKSYNEETIRQLRATVQSRREVSHAPLIRRLFHALNRLHPSCGVKGCEYCAVKQDVMGAVSASYLMSQNTLARDRAPQAGQGVIR